MPSVSIRLFHVGLFVLSCLTWTSSSVAQSSLAQSKGKALATLTGKIIDQTSGQMVPGRVTIRNQKGKWFFPQVASGGTRVEYRVQRGPIAAMHTTLSAHPFQIELPPGTYTVTARRGKEYLPIEKTISIRGQNASITLPLRRWVHMAKRGWFSGDTHSHRRFVDTSNLVMAEDLNISFPLSHWVTQGQISPVKGNRIRPSSKQVASIEVDRHHLIYPRNTEYEIFQMGRKRHTLGALLIIGHRRTFEQGAPPVAPIAQQAHQDGGLIDFEKHSWPWTLMLAPVAKVDLFELSNNHVWPGGFSLGRWTYDMNPAYMKLETDKNGYTEWGWIDYGFQTYYALLNCGFRIQPTAGTGSGVHPVPLGYGRVYVHQPHGFTARNWLKRLKAGQSFVTTGPMLFTKIDGQLPGHTFKMSAERDFIVKGFVESRLPLDRIEIVMNGGVIRTLKPKSAKQATGTWATPFNTKVDVRRSSWICVRAFERHPQGLIRFAHSSPFHFQLNGKPVTPKHQEVAYIVKHIRREIARNTSVLDEAALSEFRAALKFYERKLAESNVVSPAP